jgi:hypothetical protein
VLVVVPSRLLAEEHVVEHLVVVHALLVLKPHCSFFLLVLQSFHLCSALQLPLHPLQQLQSFVRAIPVPLLLHTLPTVIDWIWFALTVYSMQWCQSRRGLRVLLLSNQFNLVLHYCVQVHI